MNASILNLASSSKLFVYLFFCSVNLTWAWQSTKGDLQQNTARSPLGTGSYYWKHCHDVELFQRVRRFYINYSIEDMRDDFVVVRDT